MLNFRFTTRRSFILFFVIAVAGLSLCYITVQPRYTNIRRAELTQQQLKQQLIQRANQATQSTQANKLMKQMSQQNIKVLHSYFTSFDINTLMNALSQSAEISNLTIAKLTPAQSQKELINRIEYHITPIKIELYGNTNHLIQWLIFMHQLPWSIAINNLDIKSEQNPDKQTQMTLQLEVYHS